MTVVLRNDGGIAHVELAIGDSIFMMGGARPGADPMRSHMYVYVDDVDGTVARAVERGATTMYPPSDMWYGDRSAGVVDPDGNVWFVSARIEDLSAEERQKRAYENDPTA